MIRIVCALLVLFVVGCDSDDGIFEIDVSTAEPRPFIENGRTCPRADSYWTCQSASRVAIDFAAYDENDSLFDRDATGGGLLIVRAPGGDGTENATSTTFDYVKSKKNRVDLVLADGSGATFRHVSGSLAETFLSFDVAGAGLPDERFDCDLVNGQFLDGDCDGEPGGERTPIPCEIPIPSSSPLSFCTPTPTE